MSLDDVIAGLRGGTVISVGRAADMGIIEIQGPTELPGEQAPRRLHIQCPFRIHHNGVIILGSRDMTSRTNHAIRDGHPEMSVFDVRSERLNELLRNRTQTVRSAVVRSGGALTIEWGDGFHLEALPDCSGKVEMWRLVIPGGEHIGFPAAAI